MIENTRLRKPDLDDLRTTDRKIKQAIGKVLIFRVDGCQLPSASDTFEDQIDDGDEIRGLAPLPSKPRRNLTVRISPSRAGAILQHHAHHI